MRILLTIFFISFVGLSYSQNWAVFNKNYRYNYSLENETYSTVIIFADSTLIQGTDTICSLNRIAAKCDSCWFYYPEPGVADSNYIMINQPQFMQRRIVYSNNQYRLSDTSNYIIPRFLSLGNSWTFNVSRSITAQVISASIKNYFGVSDSVNTILLSTNDTVVISKQFGIVKYPAKFGQQLYYKLRGIENKSSYGVLSLYGEKVPNFYDFFKLKQGVIHYYSFTDSYHGSSTQCDAFYYAKKTIQSSAITSGTLITNSYIEDRKGCLGNCAVGGFPFGPPCQIDNPFTFPSLTINTYTINNAQAFITPPQNYNSYNNQLINLQTGLSQNEVLVKFGQTTNNHFYKTYGYSCFSGYLRELKPSYSNLSYIKSSQNSEVYYGKDPAVNDGGYGETFIEGYGMVNQFIAAFEGESYYCTSTIIDGTDTLGEIIPYGITTGVSNQAENNYSSLGPNPTKDIITINFSIEATGTNSTLEIKDVFGKSISSQTIPLGSTSEKINLQNLASGIYFIEVKMPHFQKQYKIIKE